MTDDPTGDATTADEPDVTVPDGPHEAELVFEYRTPERARLLAGSVGQEVDEIEGDRTRATVEARERSVVVDIAADDLIALRAGINTWSTLVEVAERAAAVGDRGRA